ncbi:MAG: hypothetical protein ACLFUQ_02720 [Candidatus Izemoplasmataceae bacterium]
MKKTALLIMVLALILGPPLSLHADSYRTYEEVTFRSSSMKLLEDFSETDYELAYDAIDGRRFWGWKTHTETHNAKVKFKKGTMMVIKNEGTTAIEKDYTFKTKKQDSLQLSASGAIGIDVSGPIKGFKTGLDADIKSSVNYKSATTEEEEIELEIDVDPMSELVIEVYGEGKVSNGVGKLYRFFRNTKKGGWEVFVVTTEYYSIEKRTLES